MHRKFKLCIMFKKLSGKFVFNKEMTFLQCIKRLISEEARHFPQVTAL